MNRNETVVATTLGNQIMMDAYKVGLPVNGKPVPDGAKMPRSIGAKTERVPRRIQIGRAGGKFERLQTAIR